MNIKEIARAAGVSVATISRVLNHPEQVLPETREHVLAVMKEHHYTPNWFARGLNLGRTNTIALLVPNLELNRFQQLICGVETVARSKQYAVILCHTENDPAQELAYLEMVRTRHIDGVIFAPSSLSRQQREPLLSDGVPCVHVGRGAESGFDAMCYIDQEESAFRLTQHLLSLGHESIGLLLDDRLRLEAAQVEAGCRRALAGTQARLMLWSCRSTIPDGFNAGYRILRAGGKPPRALITFSDRQAFGVLRAAELLDVAVPEELALATLADSPLCPIVSPAVTGMEQPTARLGMLAARMLFDRIESGAPAAAQEIVLQPKLKIRRSCGNRKHIYELFD